MERQSEKEEDAGKEEEKEHASYASSYYDPYSAKNTSFHPEQAATSLCSDMPADQFTSFSQQQLKEAVMNQHQAKAEAAVVYAAPQHVIAARSNNQPVD